MRARIFGAALLLVTLAGCTHEVETLVSEPLTDYLPLTPGKFITYQLDSTIFTNFGQDVEIHHYQEKNIIDEPFTDNLGRPSFRIYRYLRDSAGTMPWSAAGTYYITPSEKTIEVVENNARTLRLVQPLQEGTTWNGTNYLPDNIYEPTYEFNNDNLMSRWQFTYGTRGTEDINGTTVADVLPVYQIDDASNTTEYFKAAIDTVEASRSFSVDKYAKGIGLVAQELVLWDYQLKRVEDRTKTPWVITFSPYYQGFGVKRTLLDHN